MKFLIFAVLILAAQGEKRSVELNDLDEAKKIDEVRALTEIRDAEEPLNITALGFNPCDTRRNFNYYVVYPENPSRYIQCDPWGTGVVRTCVDGTLWNMWALRCDLASDIHNMTLVLPKRVFNCSLSSMKCLNEGVCTESTLGGDRCVCKPEWTGLNCETRVDTNDLYHEIMNGTFSIHRFRLELEALNITSDVSTYEVYRSQLDNATFGELMRYMSLYKGREVRYDTLMNNLVEQVLEDIYPDAAFLSAFNASSVSVVQLVELIPNLMSYSKYSLERYEDVFVRYQDVLGRLVEYLNSTRVDHPTLRREAEEYTRLTAIFMNQTVAATEAAKSTPSRVENVEELLESRDEAQAHTQLTEKQIRDSLRVQFNQTLVSTQRLFVALEEFQRGVAELVQSGSQDVFSMTLTQSKLNGTAVIAEMLQQIAVSSDSIWDSLVNYGFWFITTMLVTPAQQLARDQTVTNVVQ